MDYDHNAPTPEHLMATHEPFFKTIRGKHPDIPIIMISRPTKCDILPQTAERFNIIKRTYDNATASGDDNVYLINGLEFFGELENECAVDGVHPTEYITPYNSAHIKAERFWESAARIGKTSLILDIPTSGPAKSDKVIQVRGGITISAGKSPERSAIFDIPKQQFTSDTEPFIVDYVKVRAGGGIEEIQSKNDFECKDGKVYIFKAIFADARFADDEVEPHTWCIIREKNGVRLAQIRKMLFQDLLFCKVAGQT
jgi:hypothetical protein